MKNNFFGNVSLVKSLFILVLLSIFLTLVWLSTNSIKFVLIGLVLMFLIHVLFSLGRFANPGKAFKYFLNNFCLPRMLSENEKKQIVYRGEIWINHVPYTSSIVILEDGIFIYRFLIGSVIIPWEFVSKISAKGTYSCLLLVSDDEKKMEINLPIAHEVLNKKSTTKKNKGQAYK